MKKVSEGVFEQSRRLYTVNLKPGLKVYDEFLVQQDGVEYREWNPKRSKLGAAITKGLRQVPLKQDSTVLYLGAASGTTVSHVSDICKNGRVYAVEFSSTPIRDLVFLSEDRVNIIPIFADANQPEEYAGMLEPVDIVYQDVAQKNQSEILIKNCKTFLKKDGYAMIAVKSRSIDVTKNPMIIFNQVEKELSKQFTIIDRRRLEPFEHDHMFYLLKMK